MYGFESHKWTALHRLFMHRRGLIYILAIFSGALWFAGLPPLAASGLFTFGLVVVFAIHGSLFESVDRPGDYLIPRFGYGSRRYASELRRREEEAKRITPERIIKNTRRDLEEISETHKNARDAIRAQREMSAQAVREYREILRGY